MPLAPPVYSGKVQPIAEHATKRPNATNRGYNAKWQRARLRFLRDHPLCQECARAGRLEAANVVDHIIPHKGNEVLFWNVSNWQSLCKRCHDRKTRAEQNLYPNPT